MKKNMLMLLILSNFIYTENTCPVYIRTADLDCNPIKTCRPHLIDKYGSQEKETAIGHLVNLKFLPSGRELIADLRVPDPENKQNNNTIAGVVELVRWGMPDLIIAMSVFVSHKNKAIIQEVLCSAQQEVSIAAEWIIYDFDPDKELLL